MAEIKKGILDLSADERENLTAFLAAMRMAEDEDHREELAEKIDDRSSERWVDLEDFKKQHQN